VLFSSHVPGSLTLPNRIVMAPMTRNRAAGGNVPHSAAPLYYSQRALAGLIVGEGSREPIIAPRAHDPTLEG
jgi:N-ethylmaleimide reductase